MNVVNINGEIEPFKPLRIKNKIMRETGLDENEAQLITDSVCRGIKRIFTGEEDEISTATIRALINSQMIKRGLLAAEEDSRKLGLSKSDFEELLQNGCKDNANIGYSPEMIAKYAYDSIAKEYALMVMPKECATAHKEGYIHIHDLEYYMTRPNCLSGNNNIIIKDEEGNISYVTIKEFVEEMFLSDKIYYVPSLNVKTNSMEWKRIENAYLSSPSEETYLVTFGKGYTIECTSDHKFIKSHNNKAQKQYDIKVSEFDNYKDLRLCNITDLKVNNDLNDYNESALFGFFLGDGYISNKGNLKFSFSKKDKAEYLYHLLEQLNINFTYTEKESDYYDTGYLYSFYIKDKIYPQLSKSELIKKYTSKYNLTGILEGLINSDGHIRLDINNVLRLNFTNTNKSIFDLYQLCLISNGIRGSINITEFGNPNHKYAYNSSSFGEKLLSLLSSINICNRFVPIIEKVNPNMKKYDEIGELKVRSIEYTGTKPVYNLTVADNHNFLAGINGFVLTQNCMNYDLRFFARNGLKIDGKGDMGSVAKPAKSLEVLLNHMLQAWMAGATVFSGGQGYVNFNTLLSPFCKGRTYKEIKQAIQGFIFNCNMSLICRGGQVLFSSIALDLSCPDVLADEPAISFGGIPIGTYKDYQDEADLIFRAVCEISNEKDGEGAYHRFPNILFNIRKGDIEEYDGTCKMLHELGANNPTIYYNNCIDMERSTMGCRSSLPMNYAFDYFKDCCNTGNFMYNTINLPLIALDSNGDIDKFFKKLDEICEICYKSLIHRRDVVIDAVYNKHMSDFLLQTDKDTGEPLWDIDRTTITLGYCGLNEALEALTGLNITYEDAEKLGIEIIEFINKKKEEFSKRDGLRWSVIASPAESTAFRFAKINKRKYPNCKVQGTKDKPYLTNSHHIPVSYDGKWISHIRNAGKFAHLSLGGDILHIWSGEVWSDPEAIWNLNKKILAYANPIFFAYSKVFTYCKDCSFTINDKLTVCPICNSTNLRFYDRITGYYLSVDTFNDGKLQEFKERYRHKEFD